MLSEISPHTLLEGRYPKQKTTGVSQDVEKMGHLCPVGGDAKWYRYCGKLYGGF